MPTAGRCPGTQVNPDSLPAAHDVHHPSRGRTSRNHLPNFPVRMTMTNMNLQASGHAEDCVFITREDQEEDLPTPQCKPLTTAERCPGKHKCEPGQPPRSPPMFKCDQEHRGTAPLSPVRLTMTRCVPQKSEQKIVFIIRERGGPPETHCPLHVPVVPTELPVLPGAGGVS